MTEGLLFTIVGPPGVGKNALMSEALADQTRLKQLATATTRERRPNEQDGRERLFVTVEQFGHMIEHGDLLEWQEVHPGKLYGVPRRTVEEALATGQNLIADIDVLGATYIRSLYPQNVILIFVQPPSVDALEERMHIRGETEEDIQARLMRVSMEMAYLPVADYVVENDDFEQAAEQFRSIIASEIDRQRSARSTGRQYRHRVTTILLYEDSVLRHETPPPYPADVLHPAEIPHHAALRVLEAALPIGVAEDNLLRIKATRGSFISPVSVSAALSEGVRDIHFTYVYLLSQYLVAPSGWSWQPVDDADLPDTVRRFLHHQQQVRSNA